MKTILIVLLLVSFLAGAGYYGLPIMLQNETSGLKSDVNDLKQKLQKVEEFIKNEEEARKAGQLQPDADAQKIIRSVNALSSRAAALESSLAKGRASADEAIRTQKAATEEALKRQSEALEKLNKETQTKLQKIVFEAALADIRGHIAKARTDLLSKNNATAKTELEQIGAIFETLKTSVSNENRKIIEELDTTLKKARSEIDTDLSSAISRVDLLWHEMSKLLRKG